MLGSYLFPRRSGRGQFEVLGKFAKARFREGVTPLDPDYDQKTTEINLNYVIKQFNARVMIFYKDTRFDAVQARLQAVRRRRAAADVTRQVQRDAFAATS